MSRLIIKNGNVILPDRILENSALLIEDGIVTDIIKNPDYYIESDEIFDAQCNYISPGFIDTHVHGGGGCDVMDSTKESLETIALTHLRHGMTSFLPTTLTQSKDNIKSAVKNVYMTMNSGNKGARILGIHLEGPYFNVKYKGAQNPAYLENPSIEHFNDISQNLNIIKRVSIAPELSGAFKTSRYLAEKGICVSIAHSDADFTCVKKSVANGFSHITHMYNGMSFIQSPDYYCKTGVVEAGLLLDELSAEIIADGKHMPPELLKLLFKCKGSKKMLLTTDASIPVDMPEGEYVLGGLNVIVTDGVCMLADRTSFAGSIATADRLVKTAYKEAGFCLYDAVKMASLNHAVLIGIDNEIGSIAKGKKADIVIFDENIDIKNVILEGSEMNIQVA